VKIIAVDPGAVATGVAMVYSQAAPEYYTAVQFKDPLDAWGAIENAFDFDNEDTVFLIEDYRTAASLTKEAKATIGLVRFFDLAAKYYHTYGVEVVIRVEQHRLSGQREAAQLMGGTIDELKSDPNRKDAFSALAHCCVYRRTVE
jgi:hypothetical protein